MPDKLDLLCTVELQLFIVDIDFFGVIKGKRYDSDGSGGGAVCGTGGAGVVGGDGFGWVSNEKRCPKNFNWQYKTVQE